MKKTEVASRIVKILSKFLHGEKDTDLVQEDGFWPDDPFRVLITAILSQRTADRRTLQATSRLFDSYPSLESLAEAEVENIRSLIRGVAYYRTKAIRIKTVAQIILDNYDGRVPAGRDVLQSMPGVGAKTADCVLVYGFGQPAIPIDTHVRRVSKRLGIIEELTEKCVRSDRKLQAELYKIFLPDHWALVNRLFVQFGQRICKPIAPDCERCVLSTFCKTHRERNRVARKG